jgi:hypothetical protein
MFTWLSGEPVAPKEHGHDTHMCLADAFTSAFTAAISLSSSILEAAGGLRGRAIEAALIQVFNSSCAEHLTTPETGIEIHMDRGSFCARRRLVERQECQLRWSQFAIAAGPKAYLEFARGASPTIQCPFLLSE